VNEYKRKYEENGRVGHFIHHLIVTVSTKMNADIYLMKSMFMCW